MKIKISGHEEYFEALAKIEGGLLDDEGEYESAVRDYLLSLSSMKRQQIAVHAPTMELRENHEDRLQKIAFGGHGMYLGRLGRIAGTKRIPRSDEEFKTNAIVGAAMVQRHAENANQRIKDKGRLVQCQKCAGWLYSSETERIKPYGSDRYLRFCMPCAETIKLAKAIYKSHR